MASKAFLARSACELHNKDASWDGKEGLQRSPLIDYPAGTKQACVAGVERGQGGRAKGKGIGLFQSTRH